jgi:acetolactate synthase-1/2/3 large subunit
MPRFSEDIPLSPSAQRKAEGIERYANTIHEDTGCLLKRDRTTCCVPVHMQTDTVSQSYTFPTAPQPQLPFVHIWPDPNEVGRVWRPDLGIPCGPHEVVKALLRRGAPAGAGKRRGWVEGLHAIHRELLAKEWEPTRDGVNFAAIVCEVDKHMAPDATVTTDAGNFGSIVHR